MALKLRRGTDAERLAITPVEGELIYTTDTKLLYVGDGTTAGGTLVTGSGGASAINDLSDVTISAPSSGEVLKYDGAGWVNDTVSVGAIPTISDIGDVDTGGVTSGDTLVWTGSTWEPSNTFSSVSDGIALLQGGDLTNVGTIVAEEFNGRLQGDIINDSSTLVFDSSTNNLTVNNISAFNITANQLTVDAIVTTELMVAEEFNGRFQGDIVNDSSTLVYDSSTNNLTVNNIDANILTVNDVQVGTVEATTSITTPLLLDSARQIRVGNAQFPHSLIITNDSGGADDYIRVFTDTNTSNKSWGMEFSISRTSVDTPTSLGAFDVLSGINWKGHDGTDYRPAASMYTYTLAGPVVSPSSGLNVIPTAFVVSTNDSSGTEQALLFSEGALEVPGTITAPSFVGDLTGSVFADNSTLLVDSVNGEIPGYVKIADLKTALQDGLGDYAAFKAWVLANL